MSRLPVRRADGNWLKKKLDFDSFDANVQKTIDEWEKSSNKGVDISLVQALCNKSRVLIDEYIGERRHSQCDVPTAYGKDNLEPILWMLGLTCLAWVIKIVKRKTEDGHCRDEQKHQENIKFQKASIMSVRERFSS